MMCLKLSGGPGFDNLSFDDYDEIEDALDDLGLWLDDDYEWDEEYNLLINDMDYEVVAETLDGLGFDFVVMEGSRGL